MRQLYPSNPQAGAWCTVMTPGNRRIAFRIGIHLGDVIVDGEDVQGDGVNVAARIEGLAKPGGICISEDTYRQMQGRLYVGFEDIGPQLRETDYHDATHWNRLLFG